MIVLHFIFPEKKVDTITIILFFLLIIPWILPFLKSFELPGGLKIELKDVDKVSDKLQNIKGLSKTSVIKENDKIQIQHSVSAQEIKKLKISRFSTQEDLDWIESIAMTEPNLALAALRLNLEKEIRFVAQTENIDDYNTMPIFKIIKELDNSDVLPKGSGDAILSTISLLNKAVHGAEIEPEVAKKLVRKVFYHLLTIDFDNLHGPI